MIDGISGTGGLSFPYPKYYEIGLWLPSGYVLRDGDAYARGLGTAANLAVTAAFNCGVDTPVFVSAHFRLYYDRGTLRLDGVRLLGGDLADPTGRNNERRGVVMELEGFDGTLADDIEKTLRAVGAALRDHQMDLAGRRTVRRPDHVRVRRARRAAVRLCWVARRARACLEPDRASRSEARLMDATI